MGPFTQPFDYAMVAASRPNRGAAPRAARLPQAHPDGLTRGMRVTKFEHATLTLDDAGKTLVIDPGSFTAPLDRPRRGRRASSSRTSTPTTGRPTTSTASCKARSRRADLRARRRRARPPPGTTITVVHPGDTVDVEPFTLEFFGGKHAVIHETIPVVDNVGVLVNDEFYYPGDSYAVPKGAT